MAARRSPAKPVAPDTALEQAIGLLRIAFGAQQAEPAAAASVVTAGTKYLPNPECVGSADGTPMVDGVESLSGLAQHLHRCPAHQQQVSDLLGGIPWKRPKAA